MFKLEEKFWWIIEMEISTEITKNKNKIKVIFAVIKSKAIIYQPQRFSNRIIAIYVIAFLNI